MSFREFSIQQPIIFNKPYCLTHMIVIYEIKTFVAQFAMLFFSTFVSKKAFPIFSFVIGINLGVIMTYLYVSSRFADSILGSSHNSQNINFEQVQDLEKSENLNQHQSKLFHKYR